MNVLLPIILALMFVDLVLVLIILGIARMWHKFCWAKAEQLLREVQS